MAAQVLVLNTGSSSVKFEVFEVDEGGGRGDSAGPGTLTPVAGGKVEGIGEPSGGFDLEVVGDADGGAADEVVVADHEHALAMVVDGLRDRGLLDELVAVGHRVVHGGERFTAPTVIDDEVVRVLEQLASLAPLHNPPALVGIRVARDLAGDVPHVAVFDTAFHTTMAPEAFRYAVPSAWYHDHGVRRFGFHGTSHRYVSEQAAAALGRPADDCRVITLHLGNGASAAAVDRGRVVDTSMGLSPLEGLVMGTRPGDLDPGVVFHMVRAGMSVDEVEHALNHESGLKGLAGANDVRRLRAAAADGDDDARLALEVMARRIRGCVGAYLAHLGGLDALVFTAGIGENEPTVRAMVVEPLGHLGLALDRDANNAADPRRGPVVVSPRGHAPVVMVAATDEELVIARDTLSVVASTESG